MTDSAIIKASFSEWKMIKGRKVLQIICEVPLEQQGLVFSALGTPLPDSEPWVAIARLRNPDTGKPATKSLGAPEPAGEKPPAKLSQLAGILCNQGAFASFMRDVHQYGCDAVEAMRLYCGINSRKELDDALNVSARANFMSLKAHYEAWLRCETPDENPETLGRQERAA